MRKERYSLTQKERQPLKQIITTLLTVYNITNQEQKKQALCN